MDISAAFKLYDIRGEYPRVVDERLAYLIGAALSGWKIPKRVLIASDVRTSSPSLKKYLTDGLGLSGAVVFDLLEVPTPQFLFTIATGDYDLGVMITASHINDGENGFKLVKKKAIPFDQEELIHLKALVSDKRKEPIVVPRTEAKIINKTTKYLEALASKVAVKGTKKVVIDMTRSAVVGVVPQLFQKLGIIYEVVKADHGGNPLERDNRKDLVRAVLLSKADLGMIWDSDGDRVAFIDRRGSFIPMSFVFGLLAAQEVRLGQGKKVAVDVRAGLVVRDLVKEAGGSLLVLPTWSQTFKFAMEDDRAIAFGGEVSGHFVFREFFGIDDGIFAALKFLQIVESMDIEEKIQSLEKRYFELPEKNYACSLSKASVVLNSLSNYYRSRNYEVSVEDGLTVYGPDWRFNLRMSATESYLRLNLESATEKEVGMIKMEIEKNLEGNE